MNKKNIGSSYTIYIIASTIVFFIVILYYNYHSSEKLIVENADDEAQKLADNLIERIELTTHLVEKIPENFSIFLTNSIKTKEELEINLRNIIAKNELIVGSCVAFEPYAFSKDSMYAPYWYRTKNGFRYENLGTPSYFYFKWDWYKIPKILRKPTWSPPYFDEGGGNITMSTYSVPFFLKKNNKIDSSQVSGIVTVDIPLLEFEEALKSFKVYKSGFAFITYKDGTFVTHPNKNFIMKESISSLSEKLNQPDMKILGEKMKKSKGFLESEQIFDNKNVRIYYSPLKTQDWSIAVVVPKEEMYKDLSQMRKNVLIIGIVGVIMLLGTIIFLFNLLHSKQIERENIRLEVLVQERTSDIKKQNDEILAAHQLILGNNIVLQQQKEEIEAQADNLLEMNNELLQANEELEVQKSEIEHKNEQITDSIIYAKRIQDAVLPNPMFVAKLLPQHFILYKPKDIVSGDFYWIRRKNTRIYLAVADCTGHGVPGAFMSMMGISFLNEILDSADKSIHSSDILFQLRTMIMKALHQRGRIGETHDGMDIAMTIFDYDSRSVEFAAANHPLYLVRKKSENNILPESDNEKVKIEERFSNDSQFLIEFKGDKMPIGAHQNDQESFTDHVIPFKKGDMFYMLSDGYVSQFGGPQKRKFLAVPLKLLFLEISEKIVQEQREILDQRIEEWRGEIPQVDDVLVMGIRI